MPQLNELELAWLQKQGATSSVLMDAWAEFFDLLSIPEGNHNDRKTYWLRSLGYFGSLTDMEKQYYCGVEVERYGLTIGGATAYGWNRSGVYGALDPEVVSTVQINVNDALVVRKDTQDGWPDLQGSEYMMVDLGIASIKGPFRINYLDADTFRSENGEYANERAFFASNIGDTIQIQMTVYDGSGNKIWWSAGSNPFNDPEPWTDSEEWID